MTAAVRRALGTTLLALLLAVAGAALSVAPAHAGVRPITAGSAPNPGAPTAYVGKLGEHFVKFCVTNFKPHSTVHVENTLTHQTRTIHTNAKGAGCVEVPIKRGCKAITQTIVATGIGADGNPARVSATVTVPATQSYCAGAAARSGSSSGGTLPFTGADLAGIIVAAVLLIAGGTALVTIVRRRRADGSPA